METEAPATRLADITARLQRQEERSATAEYQIHEKLDRIGGQLGQVEQRIAHVSAHLNLEQSHVAANLKQLYEMHAGHNEILTGQNGRPGLLVRTDRLEQYTSSVRWLIRAIVAAILTLATTTIVNLLLPH